MADGKVYVIDRNLAKGAKNPDLAKATALYLAGGQAFLDFTKPSLGLIMPTYKNQWNSDPFYTQGDPSFPAGYWESFRNVVKATDPSALTISETWQKDTSLLRMLRGDRLDTTMNYRLRDAVLGYLSPNPFDPKGFAHGAVWQLTYADGDAGF